MASQQDTTGIYFSSSAPEVVLQQFPKELRGNFVKQFDRLFVTVWIVSAVVFGTVFLIMSLRPLPETVSEKEILKIQERYAQLVLRKPVKEVEQAIKQQVETSVKKEAAESIKKEEVEVKEEEKIDRKKESVTQRTHRKEATRQQRLEKREAVKQQVRSAGIFAAITATGKEGSGIGSLPVADLLGAAEDINSIEDPDISSGSFAAKNADPANLQRRVSEKKESIAIEKETVSAVKEKKLATSGTVNVTTAPPEIKGESAGSSNRSVAAINRVVGREQTRLKKVYEHMLQRDPNLGGRLVIKFTIMPNGSVINVIVVESTTNNLSFDKRIVSYIKRWTFPPITGGGPVEVVFPFVFSGS